MKTKLIIGLGNPEKEYLETRHNIGFMVADKFMEKVGFEAFALDKKLKASISQGKIKDEKIIVAKPITFMNNSGEAVISLAHFYKINPKDIWIIYDDLDLPLGTLRIRKDGGPGTHNGMKSVTEQLGGENFPRFRLGIESRGVTAPKEQETVSFVLSPFTSEEKPLVKKIIERAVEALIYSLENGIEEGMNTYNISST